MGPIEIKEDVYNVMTNSRELTNYCQESVKSENSRQISDSLNNFHLKKAIDFITNSLTFKEQLFFELNEVEFESSIQINNQTVYNKVIDYINNFLIDSNS